MPKHSNSLIEKAAKEDHSKLKKSSKQSKDIKKLLPIKK